MDKSKVILLVTWFLIQLTSSVNSAAPGCHIKYTRLKCLYSLSCLDEISGNIQDFQAKPYYSGDGACHWVNMYGQYYYRLLVTYTGFADKIPNGNNNDMFTLIFRLDLSNNEYNTWPDFKAMQNLEELSLSKNYLTTAKLYNIYELPNLKKLDLSYNKINTFEIGHVNVFNNLRTLNLTQNDLASLPNALFGDFTELRILDLSYNFINTIGLSTFEGLKKLSSLNLSNNRISEINGAFFRFTILQNLDLSSNKLSKIRSQDFEKLQNLIYLDISGNSIFSIESSVFANMNLLQTLKLEHNKLQDISDINFLHNTKLNYLDISHNKLKLLPLHLFKEQTFEFFDITGNDLEGALSKGMFEGLARISTLHLDNQQLTTLEDHAFYGLEVIESLYLNNNKIQVISNKTFANLANLKTLDLSHNNLTNLLFDTTDLINLLVLNLQNNMLTQINHVNFQGLHGLHVLNLANNQINNMEPKIFASLSQLIDLNLNSNTFNGSIETATFHGLLSLPTLEISHTKLTIIQNDSFSGMVGLKILRLSRNKLVELQYNSFNGIDNLEIIDVSHNQLRTVLINLSDLLKLKEIVLSYNFLQVISSNTLTGPKGLIKLDLSHNNIKSIHEDAFENIRYLHYFDISYNPDMIFNVSTIIQNKHLNELIISGLTFVPKLTDMGDNTISKLDMSNSNVTNITLIDLKNLTNLKYLILSYNNIKRIEVGAFSDLVSVDTIDLSVNKLTYIQPGAFKDNEFLQLLNMSHNYLTTISYGALAGLVHLETLDLSFNNIKNIDSERFYEVPSLKVLILDNNIIDFISTEEFSGIQLDALSIGGNKIPCEMVVNFIKRVSFKITAINGNESIKENVNGITCTTEISHKTRQNQDNVQNDHEILSDIRNTLQRMENKKDFSVQSVGSDSLFLGNISQEVIKLSNDLDTKLSTLINFGSKLVKENTNKTSQFVTVKESLNITNMLLEKIVASLQQKPASNNVSNPNDLIQYIDNLRDQLKGNMLDIKNKMDELERKLGSAAVETSTSEEVQERWLALKSTERNDSNITDSKQTVFTNICLGLILLVLVCFIMCKLFYKAKKSFTSRRSSYSTRELQTSMETPEL